MAFNRVKGTNDFYPEEMSIRNKIFGSLKKSTESFNFRNVEAPALESMGLLTCKSGDEIRNQIFTLEKRSNEEIGLRFELTASIARMFIDKQKSIPKPVRWYALSRMWRYERPQKGREREFYQLSAELFGSESPIADAEIISLVIKCLTDLGLTEKDFVIKINNRKLLQGLMSDFVDEDKMEGVFSEIDKISKLSKDDIEANLRDRGLDDDQIESIFEIINTENIEMLETNNEMSEQGLKELLTVRDLVDNRFIEIDLTTVRGLAYYTGTVFEAFDREDKFRAIAGGGRYDNMLEQFGGESCPATGFGLGFSTLQLILEDKNLLPEPDLRCDYFIAPIGDSIKESVKIAEKLRKRFTIDIDTQGKKPNKQISYANVIKAKNIIFIGSEEIKNNSIKIKNLDSGEEKTINIDEIDNL